jgi:cell division protein FtsI/penicillin-binding protein 2
VRAGTLLPVLAALSVPLLLLISFGGDAGLYRVYVPSGYLKEVDRLIGEGKLVYDCERDEIAPRDLTDGERYFLDNSYLAGDLARFRAGDRTAFLVEREELSGGRCRGELVQVSETFHNQRLPTYSVTSWRGRLFVHQGLASVSLGSPDRVLEITRPPWRTLPLRPNAFTDVWMDSEGDARSSRMALKLFEAGRMFASLEHVGDRLAIETIHRRPAVYLDGCPIPPGWRVRLDDGDWLRFSEPGTIDDRYLVEAGGGSGLISYVNVVNGEIRRRSFGNRLAMAADLDRAVDAAVVQGAAAGGRDDFDVHLTIDAFFQDLLDRRLGDFAHERYGRRPLRAGVTLLAAESGRVLALASYPRPGDLDRLRLERPAHAEVLERNHNFLQHPVGSATKPFLAAAALATRPRLSSLSLPCFAGGEVATDFLGYDFGTYNLPEDCAGVDRPVTFRRFLEVSSNRYMLALGLLAMADWRGETPAADRGAPELPELDRYSLGGRVQDRRPRLDVVKDESRPGQTELAAVQDEPFFRAFRDLFDHQVHYQAGPVADALAVELWRPVLDAAGPGAGGGGRRAALAFSRVTPERVNLKANLVQQLRQDFYTTMLGLANNRWSNLQLAGSLARLVTGRRVDVHLVERVEVPPPEDERRPAEVLWDLDEQLAERPPGELPLAADARRLILAGMEDVVHGAAGTAHKQLGPIIKALERDAPSGVAYRVVAKTGTPTTDLAIVQRGPSEPAAAAVKTYSGRSQVEDGVLVLAVTRTRGGDSATLALAIHIEAQGGSEEASALAAGFLRPLVEAYWPEDWLEESE